MEKAKKKLISSVVLAAIILVVVFCALIFGQSMQNNGNDEAFAVTGEQSEGMISGIYNEMSQSEAMAHYNSLTDYTAITSQTEFENAFYGSSRPEAGTKYKLLPYDGNGNKISYTAKNNTDTITYLDSVVIDGCGATILIKELHDIKELGNGGNTAQEVLNLPNGDKGYGTGTLFQYTPRKDSDDKVFIKVSGGFIDYTLGATISNINFEFTATFSREEGDNDAASYLYGGVFGAISVNDAGQGTTVTNCRIYNNSTFSSKKKVSGGWIADKNCRPYHATVSFGSLAGYCYNSSFTDSTVELGSSMNIYTYSAGSNEGFNNNTGVPRAISAGAIGIMQNDSLVSDIYITGKGTLNGDVGTNYYETDNSAKLGLAGGLVGCVVDQNSSAEEFMMAGLGNSYIKNIVSNWQGTVIMKGNVHGSYDYTTVINETGSLVGISGSYINNGTATNISGNYFIYGDSKPDYRMVAYGNVTDKAFSYIQVVEDGTNWLSKNAADRNVDLEFSEDGNSLNLIYDVTDETAQRSILWSYSRNVITSEGTTPNTYNRWNQSSAVSYDTATKREVISLSNTSTLHHQYSFTTGQAVYYKVQGEDGWQSNDSSLGSVGIRSYDVENREYNGQTVDSPTVEFYLNNTFTGSPVATSYDPAQWTVQLNGSGSYISVGDVQTKSVGKWYVSLRTNESSTTAYSYYAAVNGKNYVAYKADNLLSSGDGSSISMRYYLHTITPKVITPSVNAKTADDLIFNNDQKVYDVNFGSEIVSGDTVTATLTYYSLTGESGENESIVTDVKNVGNYRVRITGVSDSNYALSDSVQAHDFAITKRMLTSAIADDTTFTYNAKNQSPTVTISNQISGVDQSAVVSITYSKGEETGVDNIDAGTYKVLVSLTVGARANYDISGELEKEFTISPATLKYQGATDYVFQYDSIGVTGTSLTELDVNPISIVSLDETLGYVSNFTAYFRKYRPGDDSESGYLPSDIYDAGEYDCLIRSTVNNNYVQLTQKIKITITPATVTFGITPDGFTLENGAMTYDGYSHGFKCSYVGIGALDQKFLNFTVNIYPAVYDSEAASWIRQDGSSPSALVTNAGNYIAVIDQTEGGAIENNGNYTLAGTRELAFTINKATLTWQFSAGGDLVYNEESGEYSAEYNGQYFTLSLEGGDLESQLVAGDKGKYALTGNIEYICMTDQGNYSVGTDGVRDAGNYIVSPEVTFADGTAELIVNYDIKGGVLKISQRPVTIVVKDVEIPYGTDFDMLSEATLASMWSYAPDSKSFLEEDGQLLTFLWLDGVPDKPVRGKYSYTFIPSLVNPNANNYQINKVNESGDNSYCTITGLELALEAVVTDKDGKEVAVFPVAEGSASVNANAIYYGGDYTVTVRATNIEEGNPGIEWVSDGTTSSGYVFKNVADSGVVTFKLTDEANQVYYIGQDLSASAQEDGTLSVTFTVNKRNVTVTPNDVDVEYGKTLTPAGSTIGGDGFVEGEQDWFTYSYSADSLGADVGSTSDITVTAQVAEGHSGAEENYDFEYLTGTATRVARALHVTLNDKDKLYGNTLTVGTGDYSFADGESIVDGDDLKLAYAVVVNGENVPDAANIGVGEYALTLTSGNGNYSLVVAEGATLTVNPKTANVTLGSVRTEYDTKAHQITVVSIDGLISGDEGVTATVQYLLNGQPVDGEPVNIGVYTANVTGFSSPNYTVGDVTGTNTVEITNVEVNVTVLDAVMAYGTGNIVPADGATFFTSDSDLFNADDLKPYYIYNNGEGDVTGLAIGSYEGSLTLGFKGEAAQNYTITFTKAADLSVEKAILSEVATLEEASSVYDGNAKTVTVLGVQTDQVVIAITKDGAAVESVVDAGEYTVTVTANSTNYEGSATLTYTVNKAVFDGTLSSNSSTYNGSAVDLASLVDDKYGDVSFAITLGGETVTEVKNAGVYIVVITAGENSNYTGSVTVNYTVNKATANTPTRNDLTITAVWNGFTITDKNGVHPVLVTLTEGDWDGATNSITGLMPETDYTVYVKFAADDNYNESGVASMTVTTGKKVAAVLDPSDVTYTVYYNKIVVTVDGEGSYAYSKDGGKTWQDSNTLSGLKANTEYSISVKIKESASSGESNVVTEKMSTGSDPAAFNDALNSLGETLTAADLDKYDDMIEAYESLANGDKAAVDNAKLEKLQASYNALIAEVNGDVIAAQNVARKAAGKGVAAAAASVLAVVLAAIVAKKKFVF